MAMVMLKLAKERELREYTQNFIHEKHETENDMVMENVVIPRVTTGRISAEKRKSTVIP